MMTTASCLADVHHLFMTSLEEGLWGPPQVDLGAATTAQVGLGRRPQFC